MGFLIALILSIVAGIAVLLMMLIIRIDSIFDLLYKYGRNGNK